MGLFNIGGPKSSTDLIEGCYTLSEVPGKRIGKSLGLIEYTMKGLAGDMPEESSGIFRGLLESALEKGANAVVNVRITSGSYQQQGSQWQVTYVIAFGDAVILE